MKFDPEEWLFHRPQLGDLDGILIHPAKQSPKTLVVLCHGYGAPGTDLVDLFDHILHCLPEQSAPHAFLFPQGPIDLSSQGLDGGRAWWPINMAMLMQLAMTHSFSEMRETVPPELDHAREALIRCISLASERLHSQFPEATNLPIVLGGFSQGAMLAVDTVIRGGLPNVGGLLVYSGALICESLWRRSEVQLQGLPFVQSHGRQDTILPFETGAWLHQLLIDLGLQGGLLEFDGGHGIPNEVVMQTAKLLHVL